ncbi:MAG: hypothetical protein RL026_2677 [Pseudomonadota bacterium]|jgi:DnaK suppressor protein
MAAKKTAPKTSKAKKPASGKPQAETRKPVAKAAPAKTSAAAPKPAPVASKPLAAKPTAAPPRAPAPAKPSRPEPVVAKVAKSPAQTEPQVVAPPPVPQEDMDNGDLNLLAGPRNVQPYVPKRGEQYMSEEQLKHFHHILSQWKHDLMVEVDRTVSHMKDEAANFPDPNDRATQEEEFSLELRTRDRERKLIRKIEEALNRIDDGSYGYCLETGEPIGIKRLEARPVATLSIEAQERRERRERQYGDRDDRYR